MDDLFPKDSEINWDKAANKNCDRLNPLRSLPYHEYYGYYNYEYDGNN